MDAIALPAPLVRVRLGRLDDARLAELAAAGDERAFEELYDRHHPALLGFCRHMLGSREEGEDALQQTFLRAHRALLAHGAPDDVRPWLFAIARNRCRSIHAARRDTAAPEAEPVTDGLAADVEQRSDLRALLADIEQLPEDQRSALVLAELADMPHAEIGTVIGVPAAKVKALVHQARTHLLAEREARETPCEEIRKQLATARGGELRRGPLRRHLNRCDGCRTYRRAVADQRAALALVLPVIPSAGLKDAVLGAIGGGGGGGAAAAAAGSAAGGAASAASGGGALGLGAKLAVGAALLGGAGGGTALVGKTIVKQESVPVQVATAQAKPKVATARQVSSPTSTAGARVTPTAQLRQRAARTEKHADNGTRDHGASAAENSKGHGKALGRTGQARTHGNGDGKALGRSGQAGTQGNGHGKALGRTGEAGTQGAARRAEAQQRNAERKAATVQRQAAKRQSTPARPQSPAGGNPQPQTPAADKPRPQQPSIGNGTSNAKAELDAPATTPAPAPAAEKAKGLDTSGS